MPWLRFIKVFIIISFFVSNLACASKVQMLEVRAGYGAGLSVFKQIGAFGGIVVSRLQERNELYGDVITYFEKNWWSGLLYESYQLHWSSSVASSPNDRDNKLTFKLGKKHLYAGLSKQNAVYSKIVKSSTDADWAQITSYSALVGWAARDIWGLSAKKHRVLLSAFLQVQIPFANQSTHSVTVESTRGYEVRASGDIRTPLKINQKSIWFVGMEGIVDYSWLKFQGTEEGLGTGSVSKTQTDFRSRVFIASNFDLH